MFSEIFANKQVNPFQTYMIILCSLGVTVATIIFTNLENVFGSFNEDTTFINRLTLVYQHGFDQISSIVHLIIDVTLIFIFGSFLEKLLGPSMFFYLNLLAFSTYIILHQLIGMTGHGATAIIWTYIPVLVHTLNEGRLLKPRSVFDEFYLFLRNIIVAIVILMPLIMAFIPIYFDAETPFWKAFILGNIFHLTGLAMGIMYIYFHREKIDVRLKQFARKKKFDNFALTFFSNFYLFFYPLLVIAGFLLMRL